MSESLKQPEDRLETVTDALITAMSQAEGMTQVLIIGFDTASDEATIITNCDSLQRMALMQVATEVLGGGE